jgi:predicted  nucleic acid-binding Zn-ribbon protein
MQKEENFHKIKDSPFDTEWSENVPNTPVLDEGDSISLSPLKNTNILKSLQNLSINEYSPKHSGIYDPSMDLSGINNVSVLDPDLKSDDGNKSVYKDDMVYLSSIYDSISRLNKKLNKLMKSKFVHKNVVTDLYKKIQNNDMKSARVRIESLIDKKELDKINKKEICLFIKETFPNMYKQITEDINSLNIVNQDIVKDTEKLTNIIKSKSFEISSAKNIIKNQIKDFINKYNTMISDYKIKYNDEENFGTFFNNLFDSLNRFNQEYQNFKSEYKSIKESSDVSELKKLLEEKKMAIKQLQNENVSFSEAITKLDTNNIKLKKECVILSSEYKKLVESVKLKNKIIEKQKKILEVLQKQVGKRNEFPIDDLRNKIDKIKMKIEKESSEENKTKLVNELNDCKKRIDDFESLRNSPR